MHRIIHLDCWITNAFDTAILIISTLYSLSISVSTYLTYVWGKTDTFFDNHVNIEALIATAALLVAVLIPLAIFLMDSKEEKGFAWDKTVILAHILDAPKLLLSIFLISTPLLGWKSSHAIKPIIIALFLLGVYLLVRSMVRGYKWVKVNEVGYGETYRNQARLKYLKSLSAQDAVPVWSLTWGDTKGRALIDDRQLVTEFTRQLDQSHNKAGEGATMLREFMSYIDKLQLDDPVVYQSILNFSMKWANHLTMDNEEEKLNPMLFRSTARRLFFDLMERSLDNSFMVFLFFQDVKKYINETDSTQIATFISRIAPNFFPSLEKSSKAYDVWESFPDDWKVTYSNLISTDANLALAWLNGYMRWITSRQLLSNEKIDAFADNVTYNLFPNVEPIMWTDLLVLHWSPYGSRDKETPVEAQVRNFLDQDKTIGFMGRSTGFVEAGNVEKILVEQFESGVQEVVNINNQCNVFPFFKVASKIDEYIAAASALKYENNPEANNRRLRIIETLTILRENLAPPTSAASDN